MSNFTAIATQVVESTRYVGLEHGTERITLTIGDSGKGFAPLAERDLTPAEARELAAGLLARADELDPANAPLDVEFDPPPDPTDVESRRRLADLIERLVYIRDKPQSFTKATIDAVAEAVDLLSNFETLVRYVGRRSPDETTPTELVGRHHLREFGNVPIERLGMKAGEEMGELLGALIRRVERRDGGDWINEIVNELGDVTIVLRALCWNLDVDFDVAADAAVRRFLARTWPNIEPAEGSDDK